MDDLGGWLHHHRGLLLPIAAAAMVLVILVPLPPALLDILLSANIAVSAVILLTTIYTRRPLEFSVFPSVLLVVTLMRLVLNVATTRLILTSGADGRTLEEAQLGAGQVLWAFSSFVTSGSLAVGAIVFLIIVIIQFVVVTKGATRISEVAARFVLDAMPGKQMAIDSELSSSMITQDEARQRRAAVTREADFYGAMDGASKFLRGDAVAALLILGVNIVGGLVVGLVQYGWSPAETADLFTRLTIGDGLVTQIPAFIVSVATALMVSRSTSESNLGEDVVSQMTARPVALAITAGFLGLLAFTSLPKGPMLLLAIGCGGLAWLLSRRQRADVAAQAADAETRQSAAPQATQNIKDLLAQDTMRVELGFALVGLVDPTRKGGLLGRVAAIRQQIAGELGMLVPPIRIRDNMDLEARQYVILIRGAKVAGGKLYPNQLLAVGGERSSGQLMGRAATEPASGTSALWITPSQAELAERMGYSVLDSADVLMAHLAEIVRRHASELLSRQQVVSLLDNLKATEANLVAEVTAKLTYSQIQKVLQNLLREKVSIRDLETILESLCEAAAHTSQVEALTEEARAALGRSMCQGLCDEQGRLRCISLSGELEEELGAYVAEGSRWTASRIPPEVGARVLKDVTAQVARLREQGRRPVVICAPQLRLSLRKLMEASLSEAVVLGYNEIESVEVDSIASVGT
jgi:flagellar biosynthesis protein FlhA